MTDKPPRPVAPSDEARELLAEAAAEYATAEPHRRRHLNEQYDAQTNATADAAESGGAW